MEKIKLLEEMIQYLSYFNEATLEDFCLLASIDINELSLMNENTYRVTPLLKQIASYSLIIALLDQEEIALLQSCLPLDSTMVDDVLDFSQCCNNYVHILLEEGCNHPSISNLIVLIHCVTCYNEMLETARKILEITTDEELTDILTDMSEILDLSLKNILDIEFLRIAERLSKGTIASAEELLKVLTNYTRNYFTTRLQISKFTNNQNAKETKGSNIYYVNDWYVQIVKDSKIHADFDLKISEAINILVDTFSQLEFYKYCSSEEEYLLEELKEHYHLYKGYKYYYLKNQYCEQSIFEKCKKM